MVFWVRQRKVVVAEVEELCFPYLLYHALPLVLSSFNNNSDTYTPDESGDPRILGMLPKGRKTLLSQGVQLLLPIL